MAKKVTKSELEQIQNFVKQINNGTSQLGQIEIQKHGILHALSNVQNDLSIFQNELKEGIAILHLPSLSKLKNKITKE